MKYIILLIAVALCLQVALAKKDTKKSKPEHPKKGYIDLLNKGKREAAIASYPSSGPYRSSHVLHLQPAGGSLSIGAGYSLGGSKSFSYPGSGSFGGSHLSGLNSIGSHSFGNGHGGYSYPKPQASFSGHPSPSVSKIRYTSISGSHGSSNSHPLSGFGGGNKFGGLIGGAQFLGGSHSGPSHLSFPSSGSHSFGHSFAATKPQISYGMPQYAAFSKPSDSYGAPAASYGVPILSGGHNTASTSSVPSYALGIKGLGAYASSNSHPGISGPLFTPASNHEIPSVMYGAPSGSFGSHIGGGGISHGNLFSPDVSFGGGGSSFGGHGYAAVSKKLADILNSQSKGSGNSFKPSVYLGSSDPSSGLHGSSSHGHSSSPSFGASSLGHSGLFSGSPIYLAPKVLAAAAAASHSSSFDSHGSQGSQSPFHGSVSLSGSYDIPSAGHSASSLSFGSPSGGYSSPSVNYGMSSFGHDSDSSSYISPAVSHGSLSSGHGLSSLGHGSLSEGYNSGPSGSHGSLSSLDGLSSDNVGPTSGYSSVIKHDSSASSFASSNPFGDSGYIGSSGYNLNDLSSGKQDLHLGSGSSSFSTAGHGGSHLISSFDDQKYNSYPQEMFSQGNFGAPKGSYSSQSNVYVSPVHENYEEHKGNKYDTIKYSRDISEDEILKH